MASVAQYREDEDVLAEFIESCTTRAPGFFEPSAAVYQAYRNWCDRMGLKPMSSPALSRALGERGMQATQVHKGRGFMDIRVINPGPNWISGAQPWNDGDVGPT
jgi:phage/plasmid-associated DNA primase